MHRRALVWLVDANFKAQAAGSRQHSGHTAKAVARRLWACDTRTQLLIDTRSGDSEALSRVLDNLDDP